MMTRTRRILIFCILFAAASLAVGYAQGGQRTAGLWLAVLGLAWLAARRLDWGWVDSLALLIFAGAAALGLLLQAPFGWMLAGLAAGLTAWDLAYFLRRVKGLEGEQASQALEWQHIQRLATVLAIGLVISGAAMIVRIRFSFGLGLLGGLLAFLALSQVIGFLRRESD